MEVLRLGHKFPRRVRGTVQGSPRSEPARHQSPEEWNKLPQRFPVALKTPPDCQTCVPWQPWLPQAGSENQKKKTPGWVGSVLWKGGLDWGTLRKGSRHLRPWQVGPAQPALQLGLSAGLPSGLSLTRHSLDLKLARDLQLGMEAREPQRPSMEGVGSFPGERGGVRPGQPVCMCVVGCGLRLGRGSSSGLPSPQETSLLSATFAFQLTLTSACPGHAELGTLL